ncbi:MAG: hypothetical protein ACLUVC_10920 [Longibaculum sp.]
MFLKNLKLTFFYLKKNKFISISIIFIIYFIILPFSLYKINDAILLKLNANYICFQLLQSTLLILLVVYQSFLFQVYVEPKLKEVVFVGDRCPKFIYIMSNCLYFHMLLIPFYWILNSYSGGMILEILYLIFECFVLSCLYYLIAQITKSSLLSLGILICYCMVFVTIESVFSMFIFNQMVNLEYVIKWILISMIAIIIGYRFEKL